MKPKTPVAMQHLIQQIRQTLPFESPAAYVCTGVCKGCSLKLLDYLDIELLIWEGRLKNGEVPSLADIKRVSKTGHKIFNVLEKNHVLENMRSIQSTNK